MPDIMPQLVLGMYCKHIVGIAMYPHHNVHLSTTHTNMYMCMYVICECEQRIVYILYMNRTDRVDLHVQFFEKYDGIYLQKLLPENLRCFSRSLVLNVLYMCIYTPW